MGWGGVRPWPRAGESGTGVAEKPGWEWHLETLRAQEMKGGAGD